MFNIYHSAKLPERQSVPVPAVDPVENDVFLRDDENIHQQSVEMSSELEQNYRCMLDVKVSRPVQSANINTSNLRHIAVLGSRLTLVGVS